MGDIEAMAGYALELLLNEPRLRRMGEAARRRAETFFDSRLIVPQYEQLYKELLENNAAADL